MEEMHKILFPYRSENCLRLV